VETAYLHLISLSDSITLDRVQTELPDQKTLWAGFGLASRLTTAPFSFIIQLSRNTHRRQKIQER